jgi:LAO/AO transport system kinase
LETGAGKSSFIEAFGKYLLNNDSNHNEEGERTSSSSSSVWKPDRLAVVCVDPSSLRSGGSIMGDKTRMAFLASDPRAFVRPAATQGTLGGLAPRTDDVLRLLSQQYPLTIVETVGLGQSEVEAQQSVDMLILAVPPGKGK